MPVRGDYVNIYPQFAPHSSLREVSARRALDRREFLRAVAGVSGAGALSGFMPLRAMQVARRPKVVVVTFGGGARDEETFAPEGQENIPHMLAELISRGTFYTQVVNRGILGHYVANASLATGTYETLNNFAGAAPDHPTIFEYFRRGLKRPAADAWVIAPSNGFNRIGGSGHRAYGPEFAAEVVLPKQLLAASMTSGPDRDYAHLLRDNYETPLFAPAIAADEASLHRTADLLRLSLADFNAHARNLASPDELSVYIARQLMTQVAPSMIWITLHDIDIAHSGAFSLYLDGIRRSDRLCAEIWRMIESLPEYKGQTSLFILPDFGRDSDMSASGNGFQHHRTGDALSRTTWMLALGPGIRQNAVVDRPVESLDLVPTLGKLMGFPTPFAQGRPLVEVL